VLRDVSMPSVAADGRAENSPYFSTKSGTPLGACLSFSVSGALVTQEAAKAATITIDLKNMAPSCGNLSESGKRRQRRV
jgi:hypothetical protein